MCSGLDNCIKFQVVIGMILAILGMIWYGNATSKPGGKEKVNLNPPATPEEALPLSSLVGKDADVDEDSISVTIKP